MIKPSSQNAQSSQKFSWSQRMDSFVYAGRGLVYLVRTQQNAWIHLIVTIMVIVAGIAIDLSIDDWRWIMLSMTLVWLAEAFNTALEVICDLVSPDFHPLVKIVKDVAAGGVLITAGFAALVGLTIFVSPIMRSF